MISRSISDISNLVKGTIVNEGIGLTINGVSTDTRKIQSHHLFIPLIGDTFDGHEFIQTAFDKGVRVTLWQKDHSIPPLNMSFILVENTLEALQHLAKGYLQQLPCKVVAVTGSNGKTTTKDMITSILEVKYKVQKTIGNYNNHIGLPLTILQLEETTDVAVLEMGMSSRGEISFLTKLAEPDIAVITNIGESHLQDLGSREGITEAKLEIVDGLSQNGILIFNGDEPLLVQHPRTQATTYQIQSFGLRDENDLKATNIQIDENGSTFLVEGEEFSLPVPGKHNISNSLAAIGVALQLGLTPLQIKQGFEKVKLTGMRMEKISTKYGYTIINDAYNASPTSMKAAIDFISTVKGFKRKIVVLGSMLELGDQEVLFHQEIGQVIPSETIDYVFTFGELGQNIAQFASQKLGDHRVFSFMKHEELITHLKKVLSSDTIVLVKGSRGMKLEVVVNAITD